MDDRMITFFTVPKAFNGHIGTIQMNALRAWKRVVPDCEIILFGDDSGIAEAAAEIGAIHIPKIQKNEYGTPYLDGIFREVKVRAKHEVLCYANGDIIFSPELPDVVQTIRQHPFLGVGRRSDLVVTEALDFTNDEITFNNLRKIGRLNNHWAIDYFLFDRDWAIDIPHFLVGRAGWDNWMIFNARWEGRHLIDLTDSLAAYHQNHDHTHVVKSTGQFYGPESDYNLALMDSKKFSIHDAEYRLIQGKVVRKNPFTVQRLLYRLILDHKVWSNSRGLALLLLQLKNKIDAFQLKATGDP